MAKAKTYTVTEIAELCNMDEKQIKLAMDRGFITYDILPDGETIIRNTVDTQHFIRDVRIGGATVNTYPLPKLVSGTLAFQKNNIMVYSVRSDVGYAFTALTPDGRTQTFRAAYKKDAKTKAYDFCAAQTKFLEKSPGGLSNGLRAMRVCFTPTEMNYLLEILPRTPQTGRIILKFENAMEKSRQDKAYRDKYGETRKPSAKNRTPPKHHKNYKG